MVLQAKMTPGLLSRHARALRRTAIVVGAVIAAVLIWLDWRRAHPPDFEVFDVAARARKVSAASPEAESLADPYYFSPAGQVHLHVFGRGSTCHLHLHEHTEEATIPVWGSPRVTQRFGADGAIAAKVAQYPEGTLIVSHPDCAHEWVNLSKTEGHASLVFTLGAPFPGNLFVRPDDPRILQGAPPSVLDANADLEAFARGPERVRETPVPVASATIAEVLVKDEYVVPAREETVTFVYTAGGKGHLAGPPRPIALAPAILVVANTSPSLTLVADPGAPLAAFVFRIPRKRW